MTPQALKELDEKMEEMAKEHVMQFYPTPLEGYCAVDKGDSYKAGFIASRELVSKLYEARVRELEELLNWYDDHWGTSNEELRAKGYRLYREYLSKRGQALEGREER